MRASEQFKMESNSLNSVHELNHLLSDNKAFLLYFNTNSCSVGEALEPKVRALISTDFPKIEIFTIDIHSNPIISANLNAFVEPTILVFFDGKETIRMSRNIGISELSKAIERPYQLFFE